MGTEADREQEMRALSQLFNLATAFEDTMLLKCTIQLGLADIIHAHTRDQNPDGITLTQLAESLPFDAVHVDNLGRIMRWTVHMGLFAKSTATTPQGGGQDLFKPTLSSALILKDGKKSVLPMIVHVTEEWAMSPWHCLDAALDGDRKKKMTPFEKKHGCGVWEAFSKQPELGTIFHDCMASETRAMIPGMIDACRGIFQRIGSIVDVGGGIGIAASRIAAEFPHVKCSILDRPDVVARIGDCPIVELVAGDMFTSIPHADAILLKKILHDWDDEECVKILHRCKESLAKEGGVLIIVDAVMDDDETWGRVKMAYDMIMMVFTGGKERTAEEWKELLGRAGFHIYKITPIMAGISVIEVHPFP